MTIAVADLVDRACAQTSLSDFGIDGWQPGLQRLVEAVNLDITGVPEALTAVESLIIDRLASRLQVEQWYSEHADLTLPPIEGPLVIVGLPRTATTALHYLLATDPRFRYPRLWELRTPVPPPDITTEAIDARRAGPGSRSNDDVRHVSTADGPTEDGILTAYHFGHQELALPVPTYRKWWREADLSGVFAYHRRLLELLHVRRPPYRWLLKAPAYLFHLDDLARQYPKARFIMTHRDPVEALPSTCSIVADSRQRALPMLKSDLAALGREQLEHFSAGIRMAVIARKQIGEQRFIDVTQADFERDPIGIAQRIYDLIGLDLDDNVCAGMLAWSATNARGSRGLHHYSAEQFGLSSTEIRDAFGDYCGCPTP